VINRAVVEAFEGLCVDSLATFLSVKCLFDHDMAQQEEILLGSCETAREQLRLGMKPISKGKASSVSGAAGSSTAGCRCGPSTSGGTGQSSSGQASSVSGDATLIEIDGDGDVVACQAVDGRSEVYRTQYVWLTLRGRRVEVLPSEDDDTDSEDDDDDSSVDESVGQSAAGSHGGAVVCSISVGQTGAAAAGQPGGKASGKQAGIGFGPLSKGLNKTFARVAAFVGADNDHEGLGSEGSRLLKPRRRWVWELVIQEGPGVVCSSRYNPEEEHMEGEQLVRLAVVVWRLGIVTWPQRVPVSVLVCGFQQHHCSKRATAGAMPLCLYGPVMYLQVASSSHHQHGYLHPSSCALGATATQLQLHQHVAEAIKSMPSTLRFTGADKGESTAPQHSQVSY
jgi:hypothetical protein